MSLQRKIFINGKIFTSNDDQPYAETMIVENGKITWIGQAKDLEHVQGQVVDLQNRRVIPGLIDAHLHPLFLARASTQITCMPPVIHSIEELITALQKQIEGEGSLHWIESWGYDEGKLAERRAPNRYDLDRSSLEVPIVVTRTCGHIYSVNSKVLELAGIDEHTKNPEGGEIDRDENGIPTGILRENAKNLVDKIMPVKTMEQEAELLASLSPKLLEYGITGITEMMARKTPTDYFELYKLASMKGLKQRTVLYPLWGDLKENPVIPPEDRNNNNQIFIGGIKLFSDGSVSGKTAWVNEGYIGIPGATGICTTSKEEILAAAKAAKANRVQVVIHGMGDRAIDLIIDTLAEQEPWLEQMPSIRIEHAAMVSEQSMKKAANASIGFVPQPIFLFAEIESYLENLGLERTKKTYEIKTMLEEGVPVAFSSDAPATAWAEPANPFVGIQAAVTRISHDGTDTGKEQAVDIKTAIKLYTQGSQFITGIPGVGKLAVGYHADFVVLDRDILSIPENKIIDTLVDATYMGGQVVFSRKIQSVI